MNDGQWKSPSWVYYQVCVTCVRVIACDRSGPGATELLSLLIALLSHHTDQWTQCIHTLIQSVRAGPLSHLCDEMWYVLHFLETETVFRSFYTLLVAFIMTPDLLNMLVNKTTVPTIPHCSKSQHKSCKALVKEIYKALRLFRQILFPLLNWRTGK